MAEYQGHRSWNAWNVSLWINNDEALYDLAIECLKANYGDRARAARAFLRSLSITKTPDGAKFNFRCVFDAMEDMLD